MKDHQTRIAEYVAHALAEYREHYPDATRAEAEAALHDAISDLPAAFTDEERAA